jgi:hypothetical protein
MLVEPLDRLKGEVRQLTLTTENGTPPPEDLLGQVLSRRHKLRQWQYTVRGAGEEQLSRLGAHPAVHKVEIHAPTLEEIFVAYMQSSSPAASGTGTKEASQA